MTVRMLFGVQFASDIEAHRFLELRAMQDAGEITELRPHPVFLTRKAGVDAFGQRVSARRYTSDFEYVRTSDGVRVVEEVKPRAANAPSRRNPAWKLRYDAARLANPDLLFQIVYK